MVSVQNWLYLNRSSIAAHCFKSLPLKFSEVWLSFVESLEFTPWSLSSLLADAFYQDMARFQQLSFRVLFQSHPLSLSLLKHWWYVYYYFISYGPTDPWGSDHFFSVFLVFRLRICGFLFLVLLIQSSYFAGKPISWVILYFFGETVVFLLLVVSVCNSFLGTFRNTFQICLSHLDVGIGCVSFLAYIEFFLFLGVSDVLLWLQGFEGFKDHIPETPIFKCLL